MKFVYILMSTLFISCSSNPLTVKRLDQNDEKGLSGYWNDTDSKMVADELIKQVTNANWLANFNTKKNRKPIVVVGKIANKTSEHINTSTFIKDIEKNLVNSGRVRFIASQKERVQVRDEKMDQQKNADFDKAKEIGKEEAADFIVLGSISSILDQVDGKKVIFYQIDLELVDIESNEKIWLGDKKIKKFIQRDAYKL